MCAQPPTSVLIPTTKWTDNCGELSTQLGEADESLLIHDTKAIPVANREEYPDGVRVIAAGEPHC